MTNNPNLVISLCALLTALLCLLAQVACAIWAPQCGLSIQHPADVLMGGCLGVIMGSVKNQGSS